jgi:hypothetical protein
MRIANVSARKGETGAQRRERLKGVLYCGRASSFEASGCEREVCVLGNPFAMTTRRADGTEVKVMTRAEVIQKYREWLWAKLKAGDAAVVAAMKSLDEGVTLGCWCTGRLDATTGPLECHAQVIARAWRWLRAQS